MKEEMSKFKLTPLGHTLCPGRDIFDPSLMAIKPHDVATSKIAAHGQKISITYAGKPMEICLESSEVDGAFTAPFGMSKQAQNQNVLDDYTYSINIPLYTRDSEPSIIHDKTIELLDAIKLRFVELLVELFAADAKICPKLDIYNNKYTVANVDASIKSIYHVQTNSNSSEDDRKSLYIKAASYHPQTLEIAKVVETMIARQASEYAINFELSKAVGGLYYNMDNIIKTRVSPRKWACSPEKTCPVDATFAIVLPRKMKLVRVVFSLAGMVAAKKMFFQRKILACYYKSTIDSQFDQVWTIEDDEEDDDEFSGSFEPENSIESENKRQRTV
jgi:hypothetical protein